MSNTSNEANDPSGEPTELKKKFEEMCGDAVSRLKKHEQSVRRCKFQKNIHSVTVILINLFIGSVLFASITNLVPDTMKWIAAGLALVAASCGAINAFFRFPERQSAHESAAKRYTAFVGDCEASVAMHADGKIEYSTLAKLFKKHKSQYDIILNDTPHI